jgi:hypothetical protein
MWLGQTRIPAETVLPVLRFLNPLPIFMVASVGTAMPSWKSQYCRSETNLFVPYRKETPGTTSIRELV